MDGADSADCDGCWVGQSIVLDTGGSRDPDGQPLRYEWFQYGEAGLADGVIAEVAITGAIRRRR
jgi:hypothetical protein